METKEYFNGGHFGIRCIHRTIYGKEIVLDSGERKRVIEIPFPGCAVLNAVFVACVWRKQTLPT